MWIKIVNKHKFYWVSLVFGDNQIIFPAPTRVGSLAEFGVIVYTVVCRYILWHKLCMPPVYAFQKMAVLSSVACPSHESPLSRSFFGAKSHSFAILFFLATFILIMVFVSTISYSRRHMSSSSLTPLWPHATVNRPCQLNAWSPPERTHD